MARKTSGREAAGRKAKQKGHALEKLLAYRLRTEPLIAAWLATHCGQDRIAEDAEAYASGVHSEHVPSILGGWTSPKVDVAVHFDQPLKVSVKMSPKSQLWLVPVDRFLAGFEVAFSQAVPEEVAQCLRRFIGPLADEELQGFHAIGLSQQEFHQRRLSLDSLAALNEDQLQRMLAWFSENMVEIAELSFSRGLAARQGDHAEYLWFFDPAIAEPDLDSPEHSLLISIAELKAAIAGVHVAERVTRGRRNGGTTLGFPFGGIQMHKSVLQVRHDKRKIQLLLGLA